MKFPGVDSITGQVIMVEAANTYEEVQAANTWSDAAREAAIASRQRNGLTGAKYEQTAAYMRKNQMHHEGMAEHHEEELRLQPTDKKETGYHQHQLEMHNKAAMHYGRAAHAIENGKNPNVHINLAERHSIETP